ncbi:MAG: MFS transporter [Aquimonas sp.]|nr:MFS transporter [Aquimonas sp.]
MMFDFANSGYTTVVITAVFGAYFVSTVAGGADWATFAWTAALSLSYLLIMLSAPLLGAWADLRAGKRRLLWITTLACVFGTAALALAGPGAVVLALVLIVVSNTAFGTGENVIAAFLPELAREEAMGRLSGFGWALGYVGGLLVLGLCLWWITGADARGSTTADAARQSMLITAVAFALAALPTLLLLRERSPPQRPRPGRGLLFESAARVRSSLDGSAGLTDLRRLLVCIVFYQAGVATVITIAAIFTQEALGFTTAESIQLILVVNLTAAVGAFLFGWLQDRIGHRALLAASLLGWLLAIGLFWYSDARSIVWLAANIAGLCMGASQSVGRAMVGVFCPPSREAEIFGLWGLAVKLASILGPLCYGAVSWSSGGDHRSAMLATAAFFVIGLGLLAGIDVGRGRAARGATG